MTVLTERFNEFQPSKPNAASGDATEHTLGGKLIGGLRHLVEGNADNAAQATKRAQSNDSIANIAADTAAMIPGVNWVAAGAVRATLLSDPTANLLNERDSLAKNFAEGAALSGVTKLSGKILQSNVFGNETLARSMLSKSVGLFSFGFGAGAVQTGFASETWKNAQGQVSLKSGAEHVFEAGTIGGVIGIPAGAIGSRIGALGLSAASRAGVSEAVTKIVTGAGSGYAAGAVFGGSDAAMHGQNLSDILKSANQSGLIGLAAGGITGATVRSPAIEKQPGTTASTTSMQRKFQFDSATEAAPTSERSFSAGLGEKYLPPENLWDRLNVERPQLSLGDAERKLGSYKMYSADFEMPKPNVSELSVSGKTQLEFRREAVSVVNKNVRVYSAHKTQVLIPDDYAKQLDDVLALRKEVERTSRQHDESPEAEQRALRAQGRLMEHPLRDRAHPVDLLQSIAELPDRSISKRIIMVDWHNPDDLWHSATYKPDFVSYATASPTGDITFYQPKQGPFLKEALHHEWGHILRWSAPREADLYDKAFAVERNGYNVSDYAQRNSEENWAEHTAVFTKPDATEFFAMAADAPIRTSILAKALVKSLAFAPPGDGSVMAKQLAERVQYVQNQVLPNASESLASTINSPEAPLDQRLSAIQILGDLGGKGDVQLLQDLARTSKDPTIARAAFDAGFSGVFRQGESWKSYTIRRGPTNADAQVDYLIELAQKGSVMRPAALDYLNGLNSERAKSYYDLLTLDQFPGNKLNQAFKLMQSIPDYSGKHQAWEEGLKLVGNNPDSRVNLALAALERVPALRSTALDLLRTQAQPRTLPALEAVAKSNNPEWADKAKEAIDLIQTNERVAELQAQLRSPSPAQRAQAIRDLGETRAQQAITPLLMQVANGGETDSTLAAFELRSNFQDAVVKHYARRLVMQQPKIRPQLGLILDNKPLDMTRLPSLSEASAGEIGQ